MDHHQPLHLAAAVNEIPFINADLDDTQHFFGSPEPDTHHGGLGHLSHEQQQHHAGEPTQDEIDAVIKESLLKAEAQSRAEAEQAQAEVDSTSDLALGKVGISQHQQDGGFPPDEPVEGGHEHDLENGDYVPQLVGNNSLGSESNPILDPPVCFAPFQRPERSIEITPSPVFYTFTDRIAFNAWLEGEISWCHYVQRRSTTPDKRSAERLQTRMAKHEKKLETMSPEERARAAPLKTRRRNRVSPVAEKVTFTCHHAGTYSSQHSSNLPAERLRMNTKKSVKCSCPSRIVLSHMQTGECRVCYHWDHVGHDPYTEGDRDGGRLNKAIDEWMISQIHAGKTPDEIRRALDMGESERKDYLEKVAADPSAVDPNLPPPVALTRETKFKYSEIYNRYRKLKGPIKEIKASKNSSPIPGTKRGDRKGKRKHSDLLAQLDRVSAADAEGSGSGDGAGVQADVDDIAKRVKVDIEAPLHEEQETIYIDPALAGEGEQGNDLDSVAILNNNAELVAMAEQSAQEVASSELAAMDASGHPPNLHALPGVPGANHSDSAPHSAESSHATEPPSTDADNPLPPQPQPEPSHTSHLPIAHLPHLDHLASAESALSDNDQIDSDFASLAAHESFARALLALPGGSGLRDEDVAGMSLEEAMRRLAGEVEGSEDLGMGL